jgi:DNA-binding LacI/PurR family transcriptional regulator
VTTIAEVAERASVGVATVSRVLNGSPAVSDATRRRVLDAIDELGYERNATARALSTGRTAMLGVVAPFLAQPSVVARLLGVSRVLAGSEYQLILFDVEQPKPITELLGGAQVDGLLCISLLPSEADLERLARRQVPVVLVDGEHDGLPGISIDDEEGGRIATRHLVELGHRRIGFLGDHELTVFGFTSSRLRRAGATEVCAAAGAELICRQVRHGREPARVIAREMLSAEDRPTAVFAASDQQALGVLEAAEDLGLSVPDDLSVVGFDDIEVARYAGLTTVSQPLERSGADGAQLLLRCLEGAAQETVRLHLDLVVRATTAPPTTT